MLAVVIALVIALPIGSADRPHRPRRRRVIGGPGQRGARRARPRPAAAAGGLALAQDPPHCRGAGLVQRGGFPYFVPLIIVLVLLAIPPILTNTYAGVQNVDPAVRDAARGMGMTGSEVVRKVEFPCALPLIMSGMRSATLQVLATATIAAYVPLLGGLGQLHLQRSTRPSPTPSTATRVMVAAGMLVAVLAVLVDI